MTSHFSKISFHYRTWPVHKHAAPVYRPVASEFRSSGYMLDTCKLTRQEQTSTQIEGHEHTNWRWV